MREREEKKKQQEGTTTTPQTNPLKQFIAEHQFAIENSMNYVWFGVKIAK